MKILKITDGYVEQVFVDGECVRQIFVASSEVDFYCEGSIMTPSLATEGLYYPFDMEQPLGGKSNEINI